MLTSIVLLLLVYLTCLSLFTPVNAKINDSSAMLKRKNKLYKRDHYHSSGRHQRHGPGRHHSPPGSTNLGNLLDLSSVALPDTPTIPTLPNVLGGGGNYRGGGGGYYEEP